MIRTAIVQTLDAHDELFYRLNDPDPHTQAMAELDLLDRIFGGNFVERWLKCRCQPRAWCRPRVDQARPLRTFVAPVR